MFTSSFFFLNRIGLHESRWLYTLILTVDANFRLKNKGRTIKDDPALGSGWAHWVEDKPYQEHVGKYGHEVEVFCVFFLCLHHADNGSSQTSVTRNYVP
jgi:hypothetical protein